MTLLYGRDARGNQVPLLVEGSGIVQTSGGGGGGGWQTTYEVDFTTLTPVASYSNGTATIDGKTWTFAGLGATSSASLSAANGLRLVCNSGSTIWSRAYAPFSQFGAFPGPDKILVWSRVNSSISLGNGYSNADTAIGTPISSGWLYSYGFIDRIGYLPSGGGGGPAAQLFFAPRGHLDGTNYPSSDNSQYSTTNTSHDVRVIEYVASNIAHVWTGAWSAGWPSYSSLQFRGLVMFNINSYSNASAGLLANPNGISYIYTVVHENLSVSNSMASLLNFRVQVN